LPKTAAGTKCSGKFFVSFSIKQTGGCGMLCRVAVALTEKMEVATNGSAARLEPVEVEVIHLFVQFSRALGQPRSVAEIYGLLFVSHKPLAMDDLIERLNLSKGSASQGLKYLQDLGAVRALYAGGDRRTHYEAVTELRNMAGRFLRQQHFSLRADARADFGKFAAVSEQSLRHQQACRRINP
jgi:DNA-binding transcriptional ArsR family regulator